MRRTPRPVSFEKFYYDKVATGEFCGCAEKIIDVYEFNRLGKNKGSIRLDKRASSRSFGRWLRGLFGRHMPSRRAK